MTYKTLTPIAILAAALALSTAPVLAKDGRKSDPQANHLQLAAGFCPPGLAKKSPPCVPPGLAKRQGYDADDRFRRDDGWRYDDRRIQLGYSLHDYTYHRITRPWLYGLPAVSDDWFYAIADGRIIRVDRDTLQVLALIRVVQAILD